MDKRTRTWLISLGAMILIAAFIRVVVFPEKATLRLDEGFGSSPRWTSPNETLMPTIRAAKAVGWQEGQTPVVADGLQVMAFAVDLDHPRWLYKLPNGDVLVAETDAPASSKSCSRGKDVIAGWVMKYAGALTTSAGRVTLLRDANGDGIVEGKFTFLEGLYSPFGMALIDEYFYVANANAVVRFRYSDGAKEITGTGEEIVALPSGINYHWTKNIIASEDGKKLYITVGSNSNAGECGPNVEVKRAAILELDLNTRKLEIFAHGLRNPNGLAWEPSTGELWTVVNERDEIGSDLVPDYITSVKKGGFFGWPHFYYGQHRDKRVDDNKWPEPDPPDDLPDYAVGAHTAALGIAFSYASSLPAEWRQGMFVSLHGSWNRRPRSGYKVIYVPFENGKPSGMPKDVVSGFLNEKEHAQGRPVGVILDHEGALLIADDVGNVIWRVSSR